MWVLEQKYSSGRQRLGSWFQSSHYPAVIREVKGETEPVELVGSLPTRFHRTGPTSRSHLDTPLEPAFPGPHSALTRGWDLWPVIIPPTQMRSRQARIRSTSCVMWGGESIFAHKQSIFVFFPLSYIF